jgi:serine/threonine protein kinase
VPGKTLKFRNEGYPVIVMDFLEGKDLLTMMTKRIKEKQVVNESFLATMFRSVMESLLSMHKKLYLHRDLKLDNMVFTSTTGDLKVKLVDCGYSCKAPTGSVYETSLYGTRGFFAPESLATSTGMREYSTKTDVWQAGCALYVMLSGNLLN